MVHVRRLRGHALFLALLATGACGDGATDPGPDPAAPLDHAARAEAFSAVEAQAGALSADGLEGMALNEAIAAFLETRPEFEEVGVDSSGVWAVFTDGRALIVANNLVLGDTTGLSDGSAAPASSPLPRPVSGAASALGYTIRSGVDVPELPASRKARLLHTFSDGSEFAWAASIARKNMAEFLEGAGWEVTVGGAESSTVEALRSVAGDGFFYIATHGGPGQTRVATRIDGIYALQTSTIVTLADEPDEQTKADLAAGRLVYITAKNDGDPNANPLTAWDTRYAITPAFVEYYMEFEANSLVFLNACESGNASPSPTRMVEAFQAVGASVVLGWPKAVDGTPALLAAMVLVDRLTGTNDYKREASPHRPFPLDPVLERMGEQGWTHVSGGTLRAMGPTSGAGFGLLRPTIERMQIDTAEFSTTFGTLVIHGGFGSDPGDGHREVVIRDGPHVIPLEVLSWTPDSIRVMPVEDEAAWGFTGDVVVSSRDRPSNPRRLHAWHGTFTFTQNTSGLLLTVNMDVAGRFDMDSTRAAPGEPALAPMHPSGFHSMPFPDLDARWSASGSIPGDGCTLTWSGNGTVSSANPPPNGLYTFEGKLDPVAGEFVLRSLEVSVQDAITQSCDAPPAPVQASAAMFLTNPAADPYLRLPIDSGWRLVADTLAGIEGTHAELSWPTLVPMPAYDPKQVK